MGGWVHGRLVPPKGLERGTRLLTSGKIPQQPIAELGGGVFPQCLPSSCHSLPKLPPPAHPCRMPRAANPSPCTYGLFLKPPAEPVLPQPLPPMNNPGGAEALGWTGTCVPAGSVATGSMGEFAAWDQPGWRSLDGGGGAEGHGAKAGKQGWGSSIAPMSHCQEVGGPKAATESTFPCPAPDA